MQYDFNLIRIASLVCKIKEIVSLKPIRNQQLQLFKNSLEEASSKLQDEEALDFKEEVYEIINLVTEQMFPKSPNL